MTTQSVQVKLELGHRAQVRRKPTTDGYTHDWVVFVRGPEGSNIQHFVERVVFYLHESFPKPKRAIKEPPFQVSESGYAGFVMPIDIYFKNKETPRKLKFHYDLFLHTEGMPPVHHIRCEKLTFQNPTEDFRRKLLKAGGVGVPGPNDVSTVPTGGGNSDTSQEVEASKAFTDLFGPNSKPEISKKHQRPQSLSKDKNVSLKSKPSGSSSTTPTSELNPAPPGKDKTPSPADKHNGQKLLEKPSPTSDKPLWSLKNFVKLSPSEPKHGTEGKKIKDKAVEKSSPSEKLKEKDKSAQKRHSDSSPGSDSGSKKQKRDKEATSNDSRTKEREKDKVKSSSGKDEKKSKQNKSSKREDVSNSKTDQIASKTDFIEHRSKTVPVSGSNVLNSSLLPDNVFTDESEEEDPFGDINKDPVGSPGSSISSFSSLQPSDKPSGGSTKALGTLMKEISENAMDLTDDEEEEDNDDEERELTPLLKSSPLVFSSSTLSSSQNTKSTVHSPQVKDTIKETKEPPKQIEKQRDRSDHNKVSSKTSKASKKSDAGHRSKGSHKDKNREKHHKDKDHSKRKDTDTDMQESQKENGLGVFDTVSCNVQDHSTQPACNGHKPASSKTGGKMGNNGRSGGAEEGHYITELLDLQQKLMTMTDKQQLRQVVSVIEETGRYNISDATFDFDLCALDINTVRKLQNCLQTVS